MDIKETIINNTITDMIPFLSGDQLSHLKNSLIKNFYNYNIIEKETRLSTSLDNIHEKNRKILQIMSIEKKMENKSDKSIKQYIYTCNRLFDFTNKAYNEITTEDVYMFLGLLQSTNTPLSVNNKRKNLSAFYSWALENEFISKNPMLKIKKGKIPNSFKDILTQEEIVRLRDNCSNIKETAIIDFLLSTGCRVGELIKIKVSDIDFLNKQVKIYGEKNKTWRTVFLDSYAELHIKEYLKYRESIGDNRDILFPSKMKNCLYMSTSSIEDICKNIANKANINKKCTVHMFRRTLATRLAKKGMHLEEIAKILGHTVYTLERYYLVMDEESIKSSFSKIVDF